ncbi:hypothetical protein RJ640_018032 [Escallonia rubra]|uniref:MLO-like protein n=1 Tax=Escallonia rubra TaxID=112253 RepID=A0AA88U813_9ASTE|nr:hypothetical protein RJ640_018032 [Escallonia rubra]
MAGGAADTDLEQTPTWVVAAICPVIVTISLVVERSLHRAGKDKVPALSYKAVQHLHIFIFVLAVAHVVFCTLTVFFGLAQIRRWKRWEDDVQKKEYNPQEDLQNEPGVTDLGDAFIRSRFWGIGKRSHLLGWLHSFFKQFYASLTGSDYIALRHGFIMTHCKGNRKFNFHNYVMRALEADFKRVVGVTWYLWMFVVVFLLLNADGWHAYFYLAFVPFVILDS